MILKKDLRVLNKLNRKFGLVFDKKYKYCISDYTVFTERLLKKEGYKLEYFSGCFYPYIVRC